MTDRIADLIYRAACFVADFAGRHPAASYVILFTLSLAIVGALETPH